MGYKKGSPAGTPERKGKTKNGRKKQNSPKKYRNNSRAEFNTGYNTGTPAGDEQAGKGSATVRRLQGSSYIRTDKKRENGSSGGWNLGTQADSVDSDNEEEIPEKFHNYDVDEFSDESDAERDEFVVTDSSAMTVTIPVEF